MKIEGSGISQPDFHPLVSNRGTPAHSEAAGEAEVFAAPDEFVKSRKMPKDVTLPSVEMGESGAVEETHKPDSPAPKLARPVLLVHGYNRNEKVFGSLREYLTDGNPPANSYGGLFESGKKSSLDSKGKVFEVRFSKVWNPVEKNEAELRDAIDAICKATGSEEIDVVAYSMGALDARSYLMRRDEKIHNLVMVAPPNHGAYAADVELHLREEHGIPIWPPSDEPDAIQTLNQMRYDVEKDGVINNPFLHRLNEEWSHQKKRAHVTIIAATGTPTLVPGGVTLKGDDVVTEESARLPGADFVSIYGPMKTRHGKVLNDPRVQQMVASALVANE